MFIVKVMFLALALVLVNGQPQGFGGVGAPRQLSPEEFHQAEETLQFSLSKLAAGDGPHYKIGRILEASSQVVAGSLDKYTVELIDSHNHTTECKVSIWSRTWLTNGIEVTIDCPNQPTVTKTHNGPHHA
ncbi:uncharacterized protein Dwil_GK25384 [Drosophila willistoni]|uniref:Cystatin domain-containing protein n=1 Tax=Drosophila willistoni TaxID=7260 RepID=B4NDZ0_DROWI|nr:sarcocystatin-A [Drosophila willistoni]EDW81959.1 uncharacterized protein Dwil_GK25384 [Drosophila willistoni]